MTDAVSFSEFASVLNRYEDRRRYRHRQALLMAALLRSSRRFIGMAADQTNNPNERTAALLQLEWIERTLAGADSFRDEENAADDLWTAGKTPPNAGEQLASGP